MRTAAPRYTAPKSRRFSGARQVVDRCRTDEKSMKMDGNGLKLRCGAGGQQRDDARLVGG